MILPYDANQGRMEFYRNADEVFGTHRRGFDFVMYSRRDVSGNFCVYSGFTAKILKKFCKNSREINACLFCI
jgi:hypothetical protein